MITTPSLKPSLFRSIETDFGTTIASSLWRRISSHLNWFNKNVPVGIVMMFHGSQRLADGSPGTLIDQPMAGEWDFIDGSTISNSESPMDGVALPDITDLFLKYSSTIGSTGGSDTIDLAHRHNIWTGITNDHTDSSALRSDDDDSEVRHGGMHRHGIFESFSTPLAKIPKYQGVQAFIRSGGYLTSPPSIPASGLFTGIDDDLTEFGKLVSWELATAIAEALEYMQDSIMIGSINAIMTNLSGVDAPDPNIWQECDGSEITNENSPLRSVGGIQRYTPDLTDKYLRFSTSLGTVGNNYGANTYNFQHNHTGFTANTEAPIGSDTITDAINTLQFHRHEINSDSLFTSPLNTEPSYYTLKYYMRIQ